MTNTCEKWYEFRLTELDGKDVRVLFQVKRNSPILKDVPADTTPQRDGHLRVVAKSFLSLVLRGALNALPSECETARDDAKHMAFDVDRTYRVYKPDWPLLDVIGRF